VSADKVDVLAVLDEFALRVHPFESLEAAEQQYRDARAAVAELIAAVADVYGTDDEPHQCDAPCWTCRIRAALARVQP
jgi:hypothetical protein